MRKKPLDTPTLVASGVAILMIIAALAIVSQLGAKGQLAAAGAFDEYGYNDKAHVFNGSADGVDRTLDGKVWGDPTYAHDRLVMKWNAQWDTCNAAGNDSVEACAGAWLNNEWDGALTGGSGEVWHYKIIWVGSSGEASPYWKQGGYSVWGNYEVLMDQGVAGVGEGPVHTVYAHSEPNGYGSAK